jgi:hypothetical protein
MNTSKKGTGANQQPMSGFLVVEHTVIVGGQVIYKGSDWHQAQRIFLLNAQSLSLDSVRHEVHKRLIGYQHWKHHLPTNQPSK